MTPRQWLDAFLAGFLCLFLELALIRWLPAHVLYLAFFTNSVLFACFLGISLGCLADDARRDWLLWTPWLLLATLGAAVATDSWHESLRTVLAVGSATDPQHVYFGTERATGLPSKGPVPIEAVAALFYVSVALAMAGPGQELGRALRAPEARAAAYATSLLGSVAGVALFSLAALAQAPPWTWFLAAAAAAAALFYRPAGPAARAGPGPRRLWLAGAAAWALLAWHASRDGTRRLPLVPGGAPVEAKVERVWSPYYRIDYAGAPLRLLSVNLIDHQRMLPREELFAQALPYLLRRDSGSKGFEDVLVIGAGTGNDTSCALEWGARRVDAVEIDPAIVELGRRDHPARPYADPRVAVRVDDGRNFLRRSSDRYDLIVYALVDSLVLHTSHSNVRLESFLFTREAFADVRRKLKPGGVFALYNFYRTGWIVARIAGMLREAFGSEPIVLTYPYRPTIGAGRERDFSVILAGDVEPVREAFRRYGWYWRPPSAAPGPLLGGGFAPGYPPREASWVQFAPTRVPQIADLRPADDDWPFLYLRRPMIPELSARAIALMALASVLLLAFFRPGTPSRAQGPELARMFLLGAGFMLLEAKAVVQMALLFGSTWIVHSAVFLGVLLAALASSLAVARRRPRRLWPWYAGALATIAVAAAVPYETLLGLPRPAQAVAACLLAFSPVFFSGVLFTAHFADSREPQAAFGANAAGALAGGLAENLSMVLGFRSLLLVAAAFYVAAGAVTLARSRSVKLY